jgi:hypothetical protein
MLTERPPTGAYTRPSALGFAGHVLLRRAIQGDSGMLTRGEQGKYGFGQINNQSIGWVDLQRPDEDPVYYELNANETVDAYRTVARGILHMVTATGREESAALQPIVEAAEAAVLREYYRVHEMISKFMDEQHVLPEVLFEKGFDY